jgi:dTDP-4-dehydrorhamnose 3,5-epimerase
MRFQETPVHGVVLITPDHFDDERGFFQCTWASDQFEAHGLESRMVQRNVSFNRAQHTLRGMHYQRQPHTEAKIVSCLVGAIFDVAMDIRPDSPSYGKWFGAELSQANGALLYVPNGCAHGYLSLKPETTVEYLISEYYHPEVAGGLRWDDPFFNVDWPGRPSVINARDATYPDFEPVVLVARAQASGDRSG